MPGDMEKGVHWKRGLGLAVAASALVGLTAVLVTRPGSEPAPAATPVPQAAAPVPRVPPHPAPLSPPALVQPASASPSPAVDPAPLGETGYPVDVEALRQKLPDNLYWQVGVPTRDPEVAKKRADEAKRLNDVYGRVLSGTASEEEIRNYYDYRRRLSEDYLKFAQQVLADYGDQLPDRDRGLYELTVQLHQARLDEIPRQIDDALARKHEQELRRDAWVRSGRP